MEQWWERNNVVWEGYTKPEVEDFTGCIPLFLNECMAGGKMDLGVQAMKSVWDQVTSFISKIKEKENKEAWEKYATLSEF